MSLSVSSRICCDSLQQACMNRYLFPIIDGRAHTQLCWPITAGEVKRQLHNRQLMNKLRCCKRPFAQCSSCGMQNAAWHYNHVKQSAEAACCIGRSLEVGSGGPRNVSCALTWYFKVSDTELGKSSTHIAGPERTTGTEILHQIECSQLVSISHFRACAECYQRTFEILQTLHVVDCGSINLWRASLIWLIPSVDVLCVMHVQDCCV